MRHAISLVELLLAISVVAVLAGILVPVALSARSGAMRTVCQSNLRQIGMAAGVFSQENGGCYPAEGNKGDNDPKTSPAWFYRLPPYLERDDVRGTSVFQCPVFSWDGARVFDHASPKSYKMNGYLDNDGREQRYTPGRVQDEGEIVFFIDALAGETGLGQWGHAPASAVDHRRHDGWVNVLFLDGHTLGARSWEPAASWSSEVRWVSASWE